MLSYFYGWKQISHNHEDLIELYGFETYSAIIKVIKERSLSAAHKKEYERKANAQKEQFKIGKQYKFEVTSKLDSVLQDMRVVLDKNGDEHPVLLSSEYFEGEYVICTVTGYSSKVIKGEVRKPYLNLVFERLFDDNKSIIRYKRTPEKWFGEVEGFDKHKCGKPFTCSCCGRDFPANKGVKVDLKEIYFCDECKKQIYTPSGRGWNGIIIYTPMGNKR